MCVNTLGPPGTFFLLYKVFFPQLVYTPIALMGYLSLYIIKLLPYAIRVLLQTSISNNWYQSRSSLLLGRHQHSSVCSLKFARNLVNILRLFPRLKKLCYVVPKSQSELVSASEHTIAMLVQAISSFCAKGIYQFLFASLSVSKSATGLVELVWAVPFNFLRYSQFSASRYFSHWPWLKAVMYFVCWLLRISWMVPTTHYGLI
jgi:hypothetical protein